MQSFLGLIYFYRRFIRNYAQIARFLAQLTKLVPFFWSEKQQNEFVKLKKAVVFALFLHTFNSKYTMYVTIDA